MSVVPGEEEHEMARRRRRRPNSSPAGALEDDDLLAEILLRLPPQPSSLPRASLTCRRWRGLVRDPGFLSRFRAHHRSRGTAPVLGFFTEVYSGGRVSFVPTLDPPNRVPPERFRLQITGSAFNRRTICCRGGLALLVNMHPGQALVWDPVTGDQQRMRIPLAFRNIDKIYNGLVLRSAAVGDGHRFRFQVVLVRCIKGRAARALACVYSSDTGTWGDLVQISTPLLRALSLTRPGALVGRSLYWSLDGNSKNAILEFDLDRQNLALTPCHLDGWIMSAEGGGLGLLHMFDHGAQLWKRETDSDGAATWLLTKTIHLDNLLPPSSGDRFPLHFAEENNMLYLGYLDRISEGIFTVQTESMQVKKLPVNFKEIPYVFVPFASVYTAEMDVWAEHARADYCTMDKMNVRLDMLFRCIGLAGI